MRQAVTLKPEDVQAQFFLGNLYLLANDKTICFDVIPGNQVLDPQVAQKLYEAIYRDRVVAVTKH